MGEDTNADEDAVEVARRLRREMRIATNRLREAWAEDELSPIEVPAEAQAPAAEQSPSADGA